MARMKRNVGEQVSGKIGNVVFYQRYGKNYVRAAPTRKRDSWTEEQQLYRQRISKAGGLWRALKTDEFSKIWNSAAELMNGYAWFLKANLPALQMDGTLIDVLLLKVSDGKLPMSQNLQAERMPGDASVFSVSWQNDPHFNAERLKDELMVISYADGKFSRIMATGILRSALNGTFTLPAKPVGATHVFLFMASANGEGYSESIGFDIKNSAI